MYYTIMDYNLTYHAVERLNERFNKITNKIPLLKNWKRESGIGLIKQFFDGLLTLATENRSYLNNSKYMLHLYEKYGYNSDYSFLELKEANMLFVLTKGRDTDRYTLVTVTPNDFTPIHKNNKYSKNEKQQQLDELIKVWTKVGEKVKEHKDVINAQVPKFNKARYDLSREELQSSLEYAVDNNLANILSSFKIENNQKVNKTTYSALIGDHTVEFETKKKKSDLVWTKRELVNPEDIKKTEFLRELSPDSAMYKGLLAHINYKVGYMEEPLVLNDNVSHHVINMDNVVYYIKVDNNSDAPKIIINNARYLTEQEQANLTENIAPLNKTLSLFNKLKECKHTVLEKYSKTKSIRISHIDGQLYTYLYDNNSSENSSSHHIYVKKIIKCVDDEHFMNDANEKINIKKYVNALSYSSSRKDIVIKDNLQQLPADSQTYKKFMEIICSGNAQALEQSEHEAVYQFRFENHYVKALVIDDEPVKRLIIKDKRELTLAETEEIMRGSQIINPDNELYGPLMKAISANVTKQIDLVAKKTTLRMANVNNKNVYFYYTNNDGQRQILLKEIRDKENNFSIPTQHSVLEKIHKISENTRSELSNKEPPII